MIARATGFGWSASPYSLRGVLGDRRFALSHRALAQVFFQQLHRWLFVNEIETTGVAKLLATRVGAKKQQQEEGLGYATRNH